MEEKLQVVANRRAKDPQDRRSIIQQEYLQNELDGYVAAECPLCGDAMIRSLAQPLIAEADRYNELRFWAI